MRQRKIGVDKQPFLLAPTFTTIPLIQIKARGPDDQANTTETFFRWGMARGVYLIGSKLTQRVRAVQIVDCAGNSTTLRLKDYLSRKIQPEYKVLPWQDDVALTSANENSKLK